MSVFGFKRSFAYRRPGVAAASVHLRQRDVVVDVKIAGITEDIKLPNEQINLAS